MPYEWSTCSDPTPQTRLTLWPHRSLPRRGFAAFILGTFTLITIPLYPLLGTVVLWGLLPFLLMAVGGVWWALERRPHDARLREELDEFRDEVERFEQQLQGANVRLVELARLRRRVRELVPRMQTGDDTAAILMPPAMADEAVEREPEPRPAAELAPIADAYEGLLQALEKVDLNLEPKKVITDPQVFSYGLEQREVIAHRRMGGSVPWNRERETLILQAVALRALIAEHVEEIKGILDETAVTRDSPVFTAAREATRLGALFVRRLAHQVEEAMMDGDIAEAQALYLLKMRATRTYAGLWLMIHRP